MFQNNNKPIKHKKGDYRDIVADSMNSLDELEGLKMTNTYVSPYEMRDFDKNFQISELDKASPSDPILRNKRTVQPPPANIPKQSEDAFASMMKKTTNLEKAVNKEDSFGSFMKQKLNDYSNQKQNNEKRLSLNIEPPPKEQKQIELRVEKTKQVINQIIDNPQNVSLIKEEKPNNENKESINLDFETLIQTGDEWKSSEEIFKLAKIPKLKNGMSIETIIGMASEISNMPMEVKISTILHYLEEKNIDPKTILEDSELKSKAMNVYEEFLEERMKKKKSRIETEIDLLNKKIAEREDIIRQDSKKLNDWKNDKLILEDMMNEASQCLKYAE